MTGDEENEINNTMKNIDNNMPQKYKKCDVIMKYCKYKLLKDFGILGYRPKNNINFMKLMIDSSLYILLSGLLNDLLIQQTSKSFPRY